MSNHLGDPTWNTSSLVVHMQERLRRPDDPVLPPACRHVFGARWARFANGRLEGHCELCSDEMIVDLPGGYTALRVMQAVGAIQLAVNDRPCPITARNLKTCDADCEMCCGTGVIPASGITDAEAGELAQAIGALEAERDRLDTAEELAELAQRIVAENLQP